MDVAILSAKVLPCSVWKYDVNSLRLIREDVRVRAIGAGEVAALSLIYIAVRNSLSLPKQTVVSSRRARAVCHPGIWWTRVSWWASLRPNCVFESCVHEVVKIRHMR
jgi:hypothetical protein